jgi:hypothetical protein
VDPLARVLREARGDAFPAPRSRPPRPYPPHRHLIPLPESPLRNIIMPAHGRRYLS